MNAIAPLATLLLLCSCETTLKMDYAYSVESNIGDGGSRLQDERFKFTFSPLASGVLFTIENLGDEPAYIVWDDCYFVEPSGNTFNALNTDLVDESDSTTVQAMKSNYKTQVPAGTSVMRFTTATTNTSTITRVNAAEISLDLRSANYAYDESGYHWSEPQVSSTVRNFALGLEQTATTHQWRASRYYPASLKTGSTSGKDRRLIAKLDELKTKVEQDQPMSLGIRVDCGGDAIDYRFDFQVEAIFASRSAPVGHAPNNTRVYKQVEFGSSRRRDGWAWVFADESEPGTVSNEPGN